MTVLDMLIPFARTGRIGAARIGAQLKDVTDALGEPWAHGSSIGADGLPYLYAYGSLEVAICQAHCQVIESIAIQTDLPTMEWPARELVRMETFPGYPTYGDVLRTLGQAGCRWEKYEPLTLEGQCAIRVPASDVIFVFTIEDVEEPQLCNASVAQHRPHTCG
ncbi:hypothetical protein [Streptomyces xanthochromogenes]|uniref:RES domain-containing protein n=1 Tax=Streptomyces xanthochromogenes TaxID=67384 RepID=A0ABQ2ZHJ2_9ACTN|nr:hypothetical protein [Streptomyces xanthochromogenes]GGY13269.1 hypothetical protein GCM10010326_00630 [Streptomyces xanthochromogenes]